MKNRRTFLKTVVRSGIFAALAVTAGTFFRRWQESEDCNKNFACGSCRMSDHCVLPEADRYRLEKARVKPGS